ncbi:hypothetical protein LENED_001876 [Lentinula edodes]|uniref:Uncharacterized protein n=1 Tax=Lentinula edodes TaxID=5353 RepID=A0A1Q3DZE3_LENED|nr:hypothetical protein LENED_001876 [Lentinula edodes]
MLKKWELLRYYSITKQRQSHSFNLNTHLVYHFSIYSRHKALHRIFDFNANLTRLKKRVAHIFPSRSHI